MPPLPGSLPASPVAGESLLASSTVPGNDLSADWIVTFVGGQFNYYFGVEVSSTTGITTGISQFTIPVLPNSITAAGFLPVDPTTSPPTLCVDHDFIGVGGELVLGHSVANYPNLASEREPVHTIVEPSTFTLTPTGVTWSFNAPLTIGA